MFLAICLNKVTAARLIAVGLVVAIALEAQLACGQDVTALIANLQNSSLSADARAAAARDIGIFGADSDAAAQALIGALGNDTSAQVRAAAAMGLGKIGQPAGGAVQALQAAQAQDSDPGVRAAAARVIQLITNTQ